MFPAKRPVASALCKEDRSLSIYFAAAFLCPRLSAVSAIGDHKGKFRERVLCQMPTACHSRSFGQQDKWFLSPARVANRLS